MVDTTPPVAAIDEARVDQFAGQLIGLYNGAMLTLMIDLGNRVGLFAAAAEGPGTSVELAERAALNERYVREWLGAMVTGGIFEYEPTTGTYSLPREHSVLLTGSGSGNMAHLSGIARFLGKNVPKVAEAFRDGGGVPYAEYFPEFTDFADLVQRGTFDGLLIDSWLPLAPGLTDLLRSGARVADIGCGVGHSTNLMARAFPASTFIGYDISEHFIDRAETEARKYGVSNVSFEALDVMAIPVEPPFDAVLACDMVHDVPDPGGALRRVHDALAPDGHFIMVEPAASSKLSENTANPIAPLMYTASTLHCLTVSLAYGGPGLGLVWGEQSARQLLVESGFVGITVHPAPGDPFNAIFAMRRGPD